MASSALTMGCRELREHSLEVSEHGRLPARFFFSRELTTKSDVDGKGEHGEWLNLNLLVSRQTQFWNPRS